MESGVAQPRYQQEQRQNGIVGSPPEQAHCSRRDPGAKNHDPSQGCAVSEMADHRLEKSGDLKKRGQDTGSGI